MMPAAPPLYYNSFLEGWWKPSFLSHPAARLTFEIGNKGQIPTQTGEEGGGRGGRLSSPPHDSLFPPSSSPPFCYHHCKIRRGEGLLLAFRLFFLTGTSPPPFPPFSLDATFSSFLPLSNQSRRETGGKRKTCLRPPSIPLRTG